MRLNPHHNILQPVNINSLPMNSIMSIFVILNEEGCYEYLIDYRYYYPGFMAAWIYLFQKFGLANPYSTVYWSNSSCHLATARCAQAILSFIYHSNYFGNFSYWIESNK
jgi:hypothetical protein